MAGVLAYIEAKQT